MKDLSLGSNSALSKFRKLHAVETNNTNKNLSGRNENTSLTKKTSITKFMEKYSKQTTKDIGHVTLIIDGTGSMDSVWREVKKGAKQLLDTIHELSSEMKIEILVYDNERVTERLSPTQSISNLQNFIDNLYTSGGNSMNTYTEALEQALKQYAESKSLFAIVIGDAAPNECGTYTSAMATIRKACKRLYTVGVNSHHQSLYERMVTYFKRMSNETEGKYFDLENIDELIDVLTAMFAIETGKVESLKSMWKDRNVEISSNIAGLLTY